MGAFYQPCVVAIDVDTLKTLEDRHFAAGMGEVIKYGAAMDAEFFAYLEEHIEAAMRREPQVLGHLVRRCCELKKKVVLEDELDLGARAVLNYGHTLGHAVEVLAGYGAYYHGEAVAVGMAFSAAVSVREGLMSENERARLLRLLEAAGLNHALPRFALEEWSTAIARDKKKHSGLVRMVLARGLGDAVMKDFQYLIL